MLPLVLVLSLLLFWLNRRGRLSWTIRAEITAGTGSAESNNVRPRLGELLRLCC